MIYKIAIATPKTDAKLIKEYKEKGRKARLSGVSIHDCPYDGLLKAWWIVGYESQV